VASAVGKAGKDTGQLATVGVKKSNQVAKAAGGKLTIPADPSGALAYVYGAAQAPAGTLNLQSPNKSSVDHDISIEGNGVTKEGPVVKNGGVSKLSVSLKPGQYTFYCSVPGHRQGGMVGKLTVK
jgi:plastocyanin